MAYNYSTRRPTSNPLGYGGDSGGDRERQQQEEAQTWPQDEGQAYFQPDSSAPSAPTSAAPRPAQAPVPTAAQGGLTPTGPAPTGDPTNRQQRVAADYARTGTTRQGTDYRYGDAYNVLDSAYRDAYGREPEGTEIYDTIAGSGWKPGDQWVSEDVLNQLIAQMGGGPGAHHLLDGAPGTPGAAGLPPGMGTPESGYGPGGVNNPAFRGTTVASGATVNPGGSGTLPDGTYVPAEGEGAGAGEDVVGGGATQADRAALQYGDMSSLHGFRTDGYDGDLKASTSVKNTFAKIASRYPATPSGLRQVVEDPDFKRFFPNASIVQHPTGDKIDFGGVLSDFESGVPVGVVDVGLSFDGANDTGAGWWWGHDGGGGGGGGAMGGGEGGGGSAGQPFDPFSAMNTNRNAAGTGNYNTALKQMLQMMAMNKLFDPNSNFMLGR